MSVLWGKCRECSLEFYVVEPAIGARVPCPRCRGGTEHDDRVVPELVEPGLTT